LSASRVPKQHISQWESVAAAQRAAVARLSDNVTLGSVDQAARSALDTPQLMTHRLGHGVGLEGHEAPYLVSGPFGDKTVQSGMVFSVEPGVYDVKGGYGLRIEDCVVYRGDGQVEWLTGPVQSWGHL
jgi:Xaa-Pro aminopeptidase